MAVYKRMHTGAYSIASFWMWVGCSYEWAQNDRIVEILTDMNSQAVESDPLAHSFACVGSYFTK